MLVDDSAVIRGMLHRWLSGDPDCQVVGSYHNGVQAVANVKSCGAEIVILDVEMPEMDGLTALPQLIRAVPGIQIVMASTLTRRNADISMKALSMGAVDYLPKPESARSGDAAAEFQSELLRKIKAIGGSMRSARPLLSPALGRTVGSTDGGAGALAVNPLKAPAISKSIVLRPASKTRPEILAVGSSTGGPQALFTFFGGLKNLINVPVVITQHMPPTFTAILAEHLQSMTGITASEAKEGDLLRNGEILVAPGNYHMTVVRKGAERVVHLDQNPQVNFCRPAVDPMFESIANIYGRAALGVILTGMGHDGREGARQLTAAGGTILAQDEKSSVVWGMPGAVAEAGLCSAVVPLQEMAALVSRHLRGGDR
jgi:two-component system, chemotaxis family, protein-glutamate methylesterase/glutaminase